MGRDWGRKRTSGDIDARVLARFRQGDAEAVRRVYRAYGKRVYTVAHRVLRDRQLCEEATQQTFLNAWRAASSVDPQRELGPWLATIARRVAIDIRRREAIRSAGTLAHVPADTPALVGTPASADQLYEVWEVRRVVDGLPVEEREVVRLQHFDGLTHAEVAARLGVPVGTVKSRSHRAHRRLAAELGHLRGENRTPAADRTDAREAHR
ncbi:MAG TPA: sigma-70 family RNA polymerase sigma factor [Solirubrobacteraceae bacterium]|jgi:RNA polymerase sigma-70 factor (ECF subfamily)